MVLLSFDRSTFLFFLFLGLLLRGFLSFCGFYDVFSDSFEVVTPVTSFKRLKEGLFLLDSHQSPYTGSAYHQPPLLLALFHLLGGVSEHVYDFLFAVLDLGCAVIIYLIGDLYSEKIVPGDVKKGLVLSEKENRAIHYLGLVMSFLYLLSPFSIISCVARSTIVFTNLAILLTLYFALKGNSALSVFFCAIAAYMSIYPAMLAASIPFIVDRVRDRRSVSKSNICILVIIFVSYLLFLFWLSYLYLESWDFLWKSYRFMYNVDNMQPNIGIFWYFLTEMFESFRSFFVFVLQLHVFVYFVPILYCTQDHPVFSLWVTLGIISSFKNYPSIGDVSLYLTLLPLFYHKLYYFENSMLLGSILVYLSVLYPIFSSMWLWYGSGNPNFYYALNLVTCMANSLVISGALDAVGKREFLIKKEQQRKELSKY